MITLKPHQVYRGLPGSVLPDYLAALVQKHTDQVQREAKRSRKG